MSIPTNEKIIKNRMLLQNPYAHMDEVTIDDVLPSTTQKNTGDIHKVMGNPYASLGSIKPLSIPLRKSKTVNRQSIPNLSTMQNPYAYIADTVHIISKYALMGNPYARIDETDVSIEINSYANQAISRIEKVARNIQRKIWKHRNLLWPNGVPSDPVDLLDPSVAFSSIGYDFNVYETLDDYSNGQNYRIAGLIDQLNKQVFISNQFPQEIQRFTSAHELGHALLHEGISLHRDRGLDGSPIKGKKDKIEIEADKFAAFFLMPPKLVIGRFKQQFGTNIFGLNDDTIFALDPGNKMNLFANKKNLRYISRVLAETTYYNNEHFISLSEQFQVSVEAMAIRLEELGLIIAY